MREFRIETKDGKNVIVNAHDAHEAITVFGWQTVVGCGWDRVTNIINIYEVFPAEDTPQQYDAHLDYTAHCEHCGNTDPFEGKELVKISVSGYHGPYCTQCGNRYNKDKIIVDSSYSNVTGVSSEGAD